MIGAFIRRALGPVVPVLRRIFPKSTRRFDSAFFDEQTYRTTLRRIGEIDAAEGVGGGGPEFDARRVAVTIGYLHHFDMARGTVVDIGGVDSLVSRVLWHSFPNVSPIGTNSDLRTERLPFDDDSVDTVVCLEVLEHLSDVPYRHATTLNGLLAFLEEVYRVLRVGGKALFSTPNAASLWNIQRAMRHEPPMMYEWHFREFTVSELRRIFESIGFDIVVLRTEFVWYLERFGSLRRYLRRHGHSLDDRGDDIFIVVSKPDHRTRRELDFDLPV